jgi:KaiC/GvpD/RAD55 family RecA-like ATPase
VFSIEVLPQGTKEGNIAIEITTDERQNDSFGSMENATNFLT